MGVGWMQQPPARAGKEGPERVSGRWRVNIFFLLLVSVHSLVLPWLPVILQISGHTSVGIGVVMACIVVASLFSVKSCLVFVTATRSGAVRRFSLFFLLISSLAMYVVAIAILPRELIFRECSQHISEFSGQTLAPHSTPTSSLVSSELLLQNTSSSPNDGETTLALSSLTPGPAFTKEPVTMTSTSNTSSDVSSYNVTSSTKTVNLLTTQTTKTQNVTSTMNTAAVSPTKATPSKQTTLSPSLTTSNELNLTTEESSEEMFVVPDSSSSAIASSLGWESPSLGFDLIGQQEASTTKESLIERISNSRREQKPHHDEITETRQPLRNHGRWLGARKIEDKDEASSPRIDHPSINSFQAPSMHAFRSYVPHKHIPMKYIATNSDSFHEDEVETNVDRNLAEKYKTSKPRSRITVQDNYNELLNAKHHRLPHSNIRSRLDEMKRDEKASRNQRIKRSAKLRDEINGGRSRFLFNKEIISIPNNLLHDDEEVGITKGPVQASHGYTWLLVSILLVSASLLGNGIETSVTRLWHCYSHGYHLFHNRPRLDGGGDDLLERTLTDTFELSASGEHYGWSRVLAGGVVVAAELLLALGCQIGLSPGWSLAGQAGLFTVGSIFTNAALLIILPVPYGSIKPPKMSRPLSLYLDDEVLWEGLRRIACPSGAAIHGALCALPTLYGVLILDELSEQAPYSSAIVVLSVACALLGEGATTCCRRRLNTLLDSPGLVGLSMGSLAVQLLLTHALGQGATLWFVATSWIAVGASQALIVISTRQNALMLATIRDQEREAWVSWCSGRVGTAAGAVLWPVVAAARWGERSLHRLLVPVAAATAVLAVTVAVVAVLTRTRRAARRRVYHTLDLNACDADDEEQSDEEEDWLVRGARKEGLEL